jgi:predicted NUDIX family NTP pyrophosphohydrolase
MGKKSAGILLFRRPGKNIEFFLVHPGSPFWAGKDEGSWSVPKGEFEDEEPLAAAKREFEEETGKSLPSEGEFIELTPVRLSSGKHVVCFACEGDIDPEKVKSNTFELEWPSGSGKKRAFPEIDRAGWFNTEKAKEKLISAQAPFIDELLKKIG